MPIGWHVTGEIVFQPVGLQWCYCKTGWKLKIQMQSQPFSSADRTKFVSTRRTCVMQMSTILWFCRGRSPGAFCGATTSACMPSSSPRVTCNFSHCITRIRHPRTWELSRVGVRVVWLLSLNWNTFAWQDLWLPLFFGSPWDGQAWHAWSGMLSICETDSDLKLLAASFASPTTRIGHSGRN